MLTSRTLCFTLTFTLLVTIANVAGYRMRRGWVDDNPIYVRSALKRHSALGGARFSSPAWMYRVLSRPHFHIVGGIRFIGSGVSRVGVQFGKRFEDVPAFQLPFLSSNTNSLSGEKAEAIGWDLNAVQTALRAGETQYEKMMGKRAGSASLSRVYFWLLAADENRSGGKRINGDGPKAAVAVGERSLDNFLAIAIPKSQQSGNNVLRTASKRSFRMGHTLKFFMKHHHERMQPPGNDGHGGPNRGLIPDDTDSGAATAGDAHGDDDDEADYRNGDGTDNNEFIDRSNNRKYEDSVGFRLFRQIVFRPSSVNGQELPQRKWNAVDKAVSQVHSDSTGDIMAEEVTTDMGNEGEQSDSINQQVAGGRVPKPYYFRLGG